MPVSNKKIILNDYGAFLMTIGGPIMLVIAVFVAVMGVLPTRRGAQQVGPGFSIAVCLAAIALTVLLFVLLARRISRIKHILQNGPRAQARVREISFFKDRGRVDFEYVHNGQQYIAGTAIMKNKQTATIQTGDQIDVALDPENPKRALVVRLYQQ